MALIEFAKCPLGQIVYRRKHGGREEYWEDDF